MEDLSFVSIWWNISFLRKTATFFEDIWKVVPEYNKKCKFESINIWFLDKYDQRERMLRVKLGLGGDHCQDHLVFEEVRLIQPSNTLSIWGDTPKVEPSNTLSLWGTSKVESSVLFVFEVVRLQLNYQILFVFEEVHLRYTIRYSLFLRRYFCN